MKRLLSLLFCAILLLAAFPLSFVASAAAGNEETRMLDEIIVEFFDRTLFPGKEKQYDDEVAKVLKDGVSYVTDNVYVLKAEDLSKNPNAVLNRYKNSKFIKMVEPNYEGGYDLIPNDPNYKTMSAALTALRAQVGWDIVNEGGLIVAVIDSGVANHPDLPALLPGYSAVAGLSPNNDKVGHGTGVAGTIGALGNNGIGTVGINWNAKILPVKVDDASGALSVANIAKGIIWAADNGAKVLSMSVSTTADSVTLKNAIDYAYGKGCAIFASTGNNNRNSLNYPAQYANVMAVGATGNATSRDTISNYGPGMGVVAITSHYTTTAAGSYSIMSGTSFSTPQVSGLATLMLALNPALTNAQIYSYIQQGAKPLGGGYNEQTGYGVIDIGKTLTLVRDAAPAPPSDTTKPVLTLKGAQVMEVLQRTAFVDPGYTAIDDTDGDITNKVTVTGSVNVNTPGVYRLEYAVSDAAGNTATATRVVEVVLVDDAPPVLTLKGDQSMQIMQGESFMEPGYTAIDEIDGDVTNKVVVTGTVNVNVPGQYTLTYSVSDAAGNSSTAMRVVAVILADTTPPVLTLNGAQTMEIIQNGSFVEPGYTATDNVDGDVTSKVVVTGTVNVNVPGQYTLTYSVSDTAGNSSTATRVVAVTAQTPVYALPPAIMLSGSTEIQIFVDDDYTEPGYSAVDCHGVNLTGAVSVTSSINSLTPGIYTINYYVQDAGGNSASASRTVIVAERETPPPQADAPVITIIGSDPIILHIDSGTPYTEQGAFAYDENDGDISENVQITGSVNRDIAGTYILTYKTVNSAGLEATASRNVRILAPDEVREPRETYNFSGQGKAPTTITHTGVSVNSAGWMDLRATGVDNKSAVSVDIVSASTGATVYSNVFTAVGGTQFWADEGSYNVKVTITQGNGNCKYDVRLITPEEIYFTFSDVEVPRFSAGMIKHLISEGRTPLEICLMFGYPPEALNEYYGDFMAFGWKEEELIWFGLMTTIFDGDVPLGESPDTGTIIYVVSGGDNLTRIARKVFGDGTRWRDIYDMNKDVIGSNPNRIYAGQELTIKIEK